MRKALTAILILVLPSAVAIAVYYYATKRPPTNPDAAGSVATVAGTGHPGIEDGVRNTASFSDPFGVAVDRRGNVIVTDGGQGNRVRIITEKGVIRTIAGSTEGFADGSALEAQFNTPSGIAIDKDGNFIIADTSNNRIRKLAADGSLVSTIAGSGIAGFNDGSANEAQFDSPLGVAVDRQGNIFVADTYNDRIRKIAKDGSVTTVAGAGAPGFKDGAAAQALFDTPSGIAVDDKGNLFVADTANNAVRKITPEGEVINIVEMPAASDQSTAAPHTSIHRPVGIVVTHDGFLFLTAYEEGEIYRITPEGKFSVIAGGTGFADGVASKARFNNPAGIAVDRDGLLYVADTQNYLIRVIRPVAATADTEDKEPDLFVQPPTQSVDANVDKVIPKLKPEFLNAPTAFPWPIGPQYQWHEITGVAGEARGAPGISGLDHLHAGLDVRGNMGEHALSVIDEKVSAPIANWGFNQSSEGIRLGVMTYIHIRVGRDSADQILFADKFKARMDDAGKIAGVRVRRGTRFKIGDTVGTLNRLYHVHLNFGPWSAVANPLQFPFVDLKDTIAPTIEPGGIEVVNSNGEPFKQKRSGRLEITGDADILVTCYDRMDGNLSSRKLGIYRIGYQLLKADGAPVAGYEQPLANIEFNRLPPDDPSVFKVYAAGSGVSAYGTPTKFKYIITNRVRDGEARDGLLRTSALSPGDYIIRVMAEDFAGNRARASATELPITILR